MADIIVDDEPLDSGAGGFQEKLSDYVKTQKGFILASEMVLSLVLLACYLSSPHWLLFALPGVMAATTAVFFHVFLTGLDKQEQYRALHGVLGASSSSSSSGGGGIHWASADLGRALTGAGLYLVTSLAVVFQTDGAASGAFGLIAGATFSYDAASAYLSLKNSGLQHSYNYNLGI